MADHLLRGDRTVCDRQTDDSRRPGGVHECVPIAVLDTTAPWVDNWMVRRRLTRPDLDVRRESADEPLLPVERLLPYQDGWRARAEARIHQFHEQAWIDDGEAFAPEAYRWLPPVGLLPPTDERVFGCDAGARRRISRSQAQYLLDALVPHAPVPVFAPPPVVEEAAEAPASFEKAQTDTEAALVEADRQLAADHAANEAKQAEREARAEREAEAERETKAETGADADARWARCAEEVVVYEVCHCACCACGGAKHADCDTCRIECLLFATAHAIGHPEHTFGAARFGCASFEDCCCGGGKDHR